MQAPFENAFISFVVQLRGLGFLGMEMCRKGSHTELLLGVEPSPCPVKHTHTHKPKPYPGSKAEMQGEARLPGGHHTRQVELS